MRKLVCFLTALCGLMITIALLYQSIAAFAFNTGNYPSEPPFDAMAVELTQYLSGRLPALSALFTDRESAHMVDVYHLFQTGKYISIFAALASVLLLLIAWKTIGLSLLKWFRIGIGLFFLLLILLGIWAAFDFTGWFVAMHKVAFSNDLWLLDPNESMLIQMLPIDFFMLAVRKISLQFLFNLSIVFIVTFLIPKCRRRTS